MNVNDKIKQILIDKGLTPSYFADEIGVQRSSISHILSGRNRPSFDIIQKIIRRFPDLGYDWIMEDEVPAVSYSLSEPPANRSGVVAGRVATKDIQSHAVAPNTAGMADRTQRSDSGSGMSIPESRTADVGRQVERILIFYSDGTFREYSPA